MEDLRLVQGEVARPLRLPLVVHLWPPLLRIAARLLPWALLAAIVVGALFVRLYRLNTFFAYYPDTYAQLRAVENLLSGTFPVSVHYPPGVALFLAPVFAALPDTIATLQGTIEAVGMALVLLAYGAVVATTGDRRAALFAAAGVGFGAVFVFYSRVALFDGINTLLIALSILLAPVVVRRGPAVLVPYGLLVFAAVTVRYTNPIILPVLFLASMPPGSQLLSWRSWVDHLRSRAVVTVGLIVATLYGAYLLTAYGSVSGYSNSEVGKIVDFTAYLPRLGQHYGASLVGYGEAFVWLDGVMALAMLALVVVGARRLCETQRYLALSIVSFLVIWSPVHAFYLFFASRRLMPPFFFVLILAGLGLSVCIGRLGSLRHSWQRVTLAALLALGVGLFAGRQALMDTIIVRDWPTDAAESREFAYDEIRAVLRDLDGPSSVLVSSQSLAVDQANPSMTVYDLMRHSQRYGINDASADRLIAYVRARQAAGKTVYYHYTGFETHQTDFGKYELGFDAYAYALEREYSLREVARATAREQRLYVLEPRLASR